MIDNSASPPAKGVLLVTGVMVAGIILSWGTLRSPHLAYDDAYITYRYADNLRRGLGLVYNPGEWVLGTTTPLLALLLGALGLVTPDLEAASHWVGVISWMVAAWAGLALLWQAGRSRAGLVAGLLLAVEPAFLPSLGMETHLLVALMLAVAWAWLGRRRWLAVLLAAALLLTRQDSALWLLVLGLEVWRRERRLPWREALGTVLLASPWLLFAWWRYGSILPNSAQAKLGQNALMPVGGQSPFWRMLWETGAAGLGPGAVAIVAVLLLAGAYVTVRFARSFLWLLSWAILYVAAYTWLGVASFPWYFLPPLAAANLIMALGAGHLLGDGRAERDRSLKMGHRWFAALPPALGLILVAILTLSRGSQMRALSALQGYRPAYVGVGQWLAKNTPATASVAAIEIGVIGYISQRPILDTMGLVSPDMADHQVGWTETLAYAVAVHQPDYAVVLPATAWDGIVDRWWFRAQYEPVADVDEVTIYQRREPLAAQAELPFQIAYAAGVSLTGARLGRESIQPGESWEVWLQLKVESAPQSRYLFSLYLVDAETYERYATTTVEPFDGRYGSRSWQAGDQLALPFRLEVPADLRPGTYRLGIFIYDTEQETGLALQQLPGVADPDVRVGWFRLGSPSEPPAVPGMETRELEVQWQEGIELASVGLPAQPVAAGTVLPVQFAWEAAQPVSRDLTVFVHLVDAQGEIVAQLDRPPFYGRWPTTVWQPGELLMDTFEIPLPDTLPAGRYGLRFGFYDGAGRLGLGDGTADHCLVPDAVGVMGQP